MPGHGARAAKFFDNELKQINDPYIREFVIECYEKICPNYFWERAASKSNRYHPKFVQGPGGLARHVKYGAYWLSQLARAWCGSGEGDDIGDQRVFDCAMAAMLMHDMVKDGDEGRTIPSSPYPIINYHGVELLEAIWLRVLNQKATEEQLLILYGIAAHMGVWTKPEGFRPWNLKGTLAQKVGILVHTADYCASRKVDDEMPKLANLQP